MSDPLQEFLYAFARSHALAQLIATTCAGGVLFGMLSALLILTANRARTITWTQLARLAFTAMLALMVSRALNHLVDSPRRFVAIVTSVDQGHCNVVVRAGSHK
ncbi:hypothetical protein [Deinococcus pimensis]|uniref:hypothetical protein n=1 Tax=Deinococcus pimensis TaxID=309888 RepID=UPI00047F628F|nr:hypothetical protein [Deinococcus pimensis]